jgi:hypothetical protein
MRPFQGFGFSMSSPRVARASQPWAERFNPFGIGGNKDKSRQINRHFIENSEEVLL